MSQSSDPKRDELQDRLMDQALREVLAGETPPDLSDRILAAAEKQTPVSPQRKEQVVSKSKHRFRNWAMAVTAVCLLVGVGMTMLISGGHYYEAPELARRNDVKAWLPDDYAAGDAEYELTDAECDPSDAAEPADCEPSQPSDPNPALTPSHRPNPLAHSMTRPAPPTQEMGNDLGKQPGEGQGPGHGGDRYDRVVENAFRAVKDHPLSTFSIDVDTASYANVRRFLLSEGRLPPPDAVRIEELINYFDYDYAGPDDDVPFAAHVEVTACPWKAGHRLVRIALKGKEIPAEQRPASNLVFLLDVSGSMGSPDKLPLLKEGMKLLAKQLREQDRVAIVVYAGSEGLVLPSTSGAQQATIIDALNRLQAGGSTNGGAGIELAYRIARENFIRDGVNRVLLCTDGDFNVGTTSQGALQRVVEEKARSGVFLSVLGFGRGNLNDAMMETISNKGNGNYAYIDGVGEARKVLVEQIGGTLVTIAKDVKIQIEFNLALAVAYRLIGYENRILAAEDFNDDKKDAGEIGAGHTVTALYEVVPPGMEVDLPSVDSLKYQAPAKLSQDQPATDELLTLKLRYKQPDADVSKLLQFPVADSDASFGQASGELQFASAVASFGMLLRNSQHKGTATYDAVLEIATASKGADEHGYRSEFLEMVRRAKVLAGR